MRIPEALEELDKIRMDNPGADIWRKKAKKILDAVWLTAYEEGKERIFG